LRDPIDSRGKPLHDARNENVSMRDRPIMGMSLFSNMTQTDQDTWVGSVYNPEEGKFYTDVKVTLVSSRQIVLKGCKAWLLCGEKVWTRTSAPPPVAAPVPSEEPIEVKAPVNPEETAPKPATPIVEAAAEPATGSPPKAVPDNGSTPKATPAAGMQTTAVEANAASMDFPKTQAKTTYIAPGMVATNAAQEPLPLSGDNVTSMMVMTKPAPVPTAAPAEPVAAKAAPAPTPAPRKEAAVETAAREPEPAPVEVHKPKPRMQGSADATPVVEAAEKPKVKPKPAEPEERLPWLPPVAPRY
jgi:hypothetical protein